MATGVVRERPEFTKVGAFIDVGRALVTVNFDRGTAVKVPWCLAGALNCCFFAYGFLIRIEGVLLPFELLDSLYCLLGLPAEAGICADDAGPFLWYVVAPCTPEFGKFGVLSEFEGFAGVFAVLKPDRNSRIGSSLESESSPLVSWLVALWAETTTALFRRWRLLLGCVRAVGVVLGLFSS